MDKLSSYLIKQSSVLSKAILPASVFSAGISAGKGINDPYENKRNLDIAKDSAKSFVQTGVPLTGAAIGSSVFKNPWLKLLGGLGGYKVNDTIAKGVMKEENPELLRQKYIMRNSLGSSINAANYGGF